MILLDMPPAQVRNADPVRVSSLQSFTTAHTPDCPLSSGSDVTVTAVVAWVHLRARWCGRCLGRRQHA